LCELRNIGQCRGNLSRAKIPPGIYTDFPWGLTLPSFRVAYTPKIKIAQGLTDRDVLESIRKAFMFTKYIFFEIADYPAPPPQSTDFKERKRFSLLDFVHSVLFSKSYRPVARGEGRLGGAGPLNLVGSLPKID
jgi:hypothetical protein